MNPNVSNGKRWGCWLRRMARRQWILNWLKDNISADALNAHFHDAYHESFPRYRRRETYWGAAPVAKAIADLREMESEGLLVARRIGLGRNWRPGFPKWFYSYALPNDPSSPTRTPNG